MKNYDRNSDLALKKPCSLDYFVVNNSKIRSNSEIFNFRLPPVLEIYIANWHLKRGKDIYFGREIKFL